MKGHYANECPKRDTPTNVALAQETRTTAVRSNTRYPVTRVSTKGTGYCLTKIDNIPTVYCLTNKMTKCLINGNSSDAKSHNNSYDTSSTNHVTQIVVKPTLFAATVKGGRKLMSVPAKINGNHHNCILDTGATVSIMAQKLSIKNKIQLERTSTDIRVADGKIINGSITIPLDVDIFERYCKMKFVIMDNDNIDVLLGLDWLEHNRAIIDTGEGKLTLPENKDLEERIENVLLSEINEKEESLEDDSWEVDTQR